nr:hypothetical protein CFP56_07533 [Quercus suber]
MTWKERKTQEKRARRMKKMKGGGGNVQFSLDDQRARAHDLALAVEDHEDVVSTAAAAIRAAAHLVEAGLELVRRDVTDVGEDAQDVEEAGGEVGALQWAQGTGVCISPQVHGHDSMLQAGRRASPAKRAAALPELGFDSTVPVAWSCRELNGGGRREKGKTLGFSPTVPSRLLAEARPSAAPTAGQHTAPGGTDL